MKRSFTLTLPLCLFLAICIPQVCESRRIGCFNDLKIQRDLPEAFHFKNRMTQQLCLDYCLSRGFAYSGMQNGDWCYCGNAFGRYGRTHDSKCKFPCAGNREQRCGGRMANEIYGTGINEGRRVGCFADRKKARDLPQMHYMRGEATQQLCIEFCRQRRFPFAGVQTADWCYCGHSYGRYGPANEEDCSMPCMGDPSQTCGGRLVNEVFTTGA